MKREKIHLTDYALTGGAILTWWVVPIMLAVGFVILAIQFFIKKAFKFRLVIKLSQKKGDI